jgi:hypothetical protein
MAGRLRVGAAATLLGLLGGAGLLTLNHALATPPDPPPLGPPIRAGTATPPVEPTQGAVRVDPLPPPGSERDDEDGEDPD